MLYLFSGRPRKNSIAAWLRKLSKKLGVTVQVEMVDIQVRPHLDVTLSKVRDFLLSKISTGQYFAILLSPPCSTFSRAPWANKKGPRPVRSFVFPRGFTRMTWSERKRTDWGNVLADFSFQAFATHAASNPEGMEAFENPEDLGAVKTGEHQGVRPSSMWQWPDFDMLLLQEDTTTAAFYQQDFGTEYLKPTRLLLRNFRQLPEFFVEGKPLFDEQGYYAGPLESRQATKQLIGFSAGQFQTTGTEQWPSQMCEWMALQILQGFMARQNAGQNTTVTADEGEITQDTDVFLFQNLMEGNWWEVWESRGSVRRQASQELFMMGPGWHPWDAGTLRNVFGRKAVFGRFLDRNHWTWFAVILQRDAPWTGFVLRWQSKAKVDVLW